MAKRLRVPDVQIPSRDLTNPVFAQPEPTPDPSTFKITHPSDDAAYKIIDELNAEHKIKPLPFSPVARESDRAATEFDASLRR
jgi:hypothetical protein